MTSPAHVGNRSKQTVWATAVTDTVKLMGVPLNGCKFTPVNNAVVHEEMRGNLAGGHLADLTEIGATGQIQMIASYQDINYLLESLMGDVTPGAGPPYARAGVAPSTAIPTRRMMTVIYGDGTNIYKATGAIVTKMVIKGAAKQPLMVTADFIAKSISTGTFAALADRTVKVCMSQEALIYVDTWAGTIGSTALSAIGWDFTLTLDSGAALDHFLGALAAGSYHDGSSWKGTLEMNYELQTTSKAYLDAIILGTAVQQNQVRIKYTVDANAIMQFDFAGSVEKAPDMFDYRDGVVGTKIVYTRTNNTTLGNWFKYSNTNAVAVLP